MAKTAAETLKLSGFNEKQAQAILDLIDDNTVTRKDLKLLEQGVKLWLAGVALSVAGIVCIIGLALHNGYKEGIAGVENRLQAEIAGVESRLQAEIAGVKEDIKELKTSVRRIEEALLNRKL